MTALLYLSISFINNFVYPKNSVVPFDLYFRVPFSNNGITPDRSSCCGNYVANMTTAGTLYLYNCLANTQTMSVSECYIIRIA